MRVFFFSLPVAPASERSCDRPIDADLSVKLDNGARAPFSPLPALDDFPIRETPERSLPPRAFTAVETFSFFLFSSFFLFLNTPAAPAGLLVHVSRVPSGF